MPVIGHSLSRRSISCRLNPATESDCIFMAPRLYSPQFWLGISILIVRELVDDSGTKIDVVTIATFADVVFVWVDRDVAVRANWPASGDDVHAALSDEYSLLVGKTKLQYNRVRIFFTRLDLIQSDARRCEKEDLLARVVLHRDARRFKFDFPFRIRRHIGKSPISDIGVLIHLLERVAQREGDVIQLLFFKPDYRRAAFAIGGDVEGSLSWLAVSQNLQIVNNSKVS